MGRRATSEAYVRNRSCRKDWPDPGEPREDWTIFCKESERAYPNTPSEFVWLKEFRRMQQRGSVQRGSNKSCAHRVRACSKVEQMLFHDEPGQGDLEAEFMPPVSPAKYELAELIQISEEKRKPPRLSQRRIQIPGRRLERFVLPVWQPRKFSSNGSVIDQARCQEREREDSRNLAWDRAILKVAMRCNAIGGREKRA
jgi:hypothetical protein